MRLFHYATIACMVLGSSTLALAQAGSAIQWQADLDAARAMAERENKLLLVHFYTESCGPCRMLDATVFNQPSVAGAVHTNYVPVKLNANEFQATAERFGITRVPTDVIITAQGRVLERMVSPATPMAYIGQLAGIATQHQRQTGRDFSVANANTGTSQPVNSAYAGLTVAGDDNAFTAPASPTPPGVASNPYINTRSPSGTVAPQYNAAAAAPAAATPAATPSPAAQPVAMANPYAQQPVAPEAPAQTPPIVDRYASTAPAIDKAAAPVEPAPTAEPQLPADSPPLGFFGYCPVTMKKENRWQRGDVRWGCYHRGRTYLFASPEHRDEFHANGDDFAPALSGIDPVLAIDSGKVEPGKQDFGIEYNGQFYLFSSEDNLRKFWSEAERYATGVRQATNAAPDGAKYR